MEAIKTAIGASPLLAFVAVAAIYAIGDLVGTVSKAWIPSTFVMACLFLFGYWTILPTDVVAVSGIKGLATLSIYLLITHMGSSISLKELGRQWKVIVVCLAGLAGMVAAGLGIAALFVDRTYIIAGLPPLTGGLVAALTMQQAAQDKGLQVAAVLAIAMYSVQGFAGYPLTAVALKKEGKRLLKDYRAGKVISVDSSAAGAAAATERKKLIPATPAKYYSTALALLKTGLVAFLAFKIGAWTAGWGYFKINGAVAALVLGIVFTELGFLEKDVLKQCGCFNFIAFALMLYVFDGLSGATPEVLGSAIVPMLVLIAIGVAGMCLVAFLLAKPMKMSPAMAIATNLTALYGFPPNYVLTDEACKALAETPEEKEYLMDRMLPQMIVGGFVTVTITSVIIAGIFANLL